MQFSKFSLSFIMTLSSLLLYSQDIKLENLRASQDGRISFEYTIVKGHSDRERYDVKILTSADDFTNPLRIKLDGIPPEQKQTVSFKGTEHLPRGYSGAVRIRLVAEATVYPVQITDYSRKAKGGSAISIAWTDANGNNAYDLILTDGGLEKELATAVRGNSFNGNLPTEVEKGSYDLKVVPQGDANNASDVVPFSVAGGIGLGLKLIGGAALAGVGVLAAGSSGGGGGGGTTGGGDSLPGPPDVPDN